MPKHEDFCFSPTIEKYKLGFYRHRCYGLARIIRDYDIPYLTKYAPELKEFEVETPDTVSGEFSKNGYKSILVPNVFTQPLKSQ
jgi:hypothetical protein